MLKKVRIDWVAREWKVGLFGFCFAALVYAVFRPEPPPELFTNSDKLGHLVAFGLVALSATFAFPDSKIRVISLLLVMAPLMEVLQGMLNPARMASHEDALANVTGVLLAGVCYQLLQSAAERKSSSS